MSRGMALPSGWTLDTYIAHNEAMREQEEKFQQERDRRISEVASEHDKALKIKDESDDRALELARQINDLHLAALNGEQSRLLADRERFISRESYDIAQKDFASWRDSVNASLSMGAGRGAGMAQFYGWIVAGVVLVVTVANFLMGKH